MDLPAQHLETLQEARASPGSVWRFTALPGAWERTWLCWLPFPRKTNPKRQNGCLRRRTGWESSYETEARAGQGRPPSHGT